jgi:hypothetical protein
MTPYFSPNLYGAEPDCQFCNLLSLLLRTKKMAKASGCFCTIRSCFEKIARNLGSIFMLVGVGQL